jgi:DNA-directed RNA polymerase specialized sigma24 family protein
MNATVNPTNNNNNIKLSENQRLLVSEFYPLVRIVALHQAGRDGDLDQIESDVQFALVMAVGQFNGEPGSDRELFIEHVKHSMFKEAIQSKYQRIGIQMLGLDDGQYEFFDEKSAVAIDRIIDEWKLQDLSGCMSREEWAVIHDLVIGGLSAEESSASLGITLSRVVELYNSAGDKIRSYYARCLGNENQKTRGR